MQFPSFLTDKIKFIDEPYIPSDWRILITGITSIHGWPIYQRLNKLIPKDQLLAVRSPKMDIPIDKNVFSLCITDTDEFLKIKKTFNPTHIIHAAGVCDLDVCEIRKEWAESINQGGARNIVDVFGDSLYILFISSDLVFSGRNPPQTGYSENDKADPVSIVGKTLFQAEKEIIRAKNNCIIRLGLPMGDSITGTKGPIDFIEKRFKRKLPMTLFYDEVRSFINCDELAEIVLHLFCKQETGLYHLGGIEPVSLYALGEKIIEKGSYSKKLLHKLSIHEEKNGPPRIGNVSFNSSKIKNWFEIVFTDICK
ncbi:sugar nucleotide-binding protein [Candidatus Poribacteria bacterium]|nr:sugar nucleotide-binding protein [Candidatus Poribacteria bacterium]